VLNGENQPRHVHRALFFAIPKLPFGPGEI
jgi:hypothetical protein